MEEIEPPFISAIMGEVMPQRFWIPPVIQYSGSEDPSEHFISSKKSRKLNTHLFTIKQGPKESLKDYIAYFNEEALQVEDYDDKMALSTMFSGLKKGKFTFSIGKNPPKMLAELITRAQKYTNAEEFSNAGKNVQVTEPTGKGKMQRNEEPQPSSKRLDDRAPRNHCPRRKPEDKSKYCHFHRDHDHNTADCVDLKDEIETLIQEPVEIRTIFGGSSGGGDSNRARKAHSQNSDPELSIHMTERPTKELWVSPCSLTFMEDDARGIQHPHDNALVVTMTIANHKVYHILVSTGSLADVIYSEAFERMEISRSHFRPVKTPYTTLPEKGPSLNVMRAVVSTYHLMMKFPTEGGTSYLGGNQREARRCYAIAVKKGSVKQALTINILDPGGPAEDSSVEDLEKIQLDEADLSKTV
ncbi:uncharacterized protein LOC131228777 [Magnolia sinica]|uniref:uncharacterized protein LOC131228777 n=1 Tax=Magnolia sinica TaxID=86752 RepID=UPI00265919C8|nr:uncharacterized protein LOC131228777 [Magnolia sinica]